MNVIEECDFGPIGGLTELKVLTWREYHLEAALAGHEPARTWLEQEYPGWGNQPWKKVPRALRTERIKRLEQEEKLAAANQITLSLEEDREAHAQAVAGDRPLIALPNRITQEALAKVDGLTHQKYERLLAQRGFPTREAPRLAIDWSLPDETIVAFAPETKRGLYKDFATGEKASRDVCKLWKTVRGIPEDEHARFFADLAGLAGTQFGYTPPREKGEKEFKCTTEEVEAWLADLKIADLKRLAQHPKRRYELATLGWLGAEQQQLAKRRDQILFLMRDPAGTVVGVHRWLEAEGKLKFLGSPTLFAFGDSEAPGEVHINESVWDKIALIEWTSWFLREGVLFLCTRGATQTKLLKGRIPTGAKVYVWEQHDKPDENGKRANQDWQANVARLAAKAGCQVYLVRIPPQSKDINERTIAGATAEELAKAVNDAGLFQEPNHLSPERGDPDKNGS